MTQPGLFDLPQMSALTTFSCHDCGRELSEMDALLPKTCERSSVCTQCCQACHGEALNRLIATMTRTRSTLGLPVFPKRVSR